MTKIKTKTKTKSNTRQNKTYQTPVADNHYNLLSPSEGSGREIYTVNEVQQTEGSGKYSKKVPGVNKKKIIILGDSHANGYVQQVQHSLGQDYLVQGLVKPGANTEAIINT